MACWADDGEEDEISLKGFEEGAEDDEEEPRLSPVPSGAEHEPEETSASGPWPVSIPSGSFLAVVSDETDKTEALLPYLADAHAAGRAPGETRQEVFAFCADTSKPPFRLAQNGAALLDLRNLMGWVDARRERTESMRAAGFEPPPALLIFHWARERRFFQEPAVNRLLVEELARLACSVVVVSRYMLDVTWAVRSHVDAVICCGVENLKCIYHLYTQFGSVYHRENEFSRLVSRRDRWTWIDNSKELPARLKPNSERGMYDVLFDAVTLLPSGAETVSRVAIDKPGAAVVTLPSAEPGGGGLQRSDAKQMMVAKILRWHASAVDLDRWFDSSQSEPRGVWKEQTWLARESFDQIVRLLLRPEELASFERRSLGNWNSSMDEYELPSWSESLAASRLFSPDLVQDAPTGNATDVSPPANRTDQEVFREPSTDPKSWNENSGREPTSAKDGTKQGPNDEDDPMQWL